MTIVVKGKTHRWVENTSLFIANTLTCLRLLIVTLSFEFKLKTKHITHGQVEIVLSVTLDN